MNLGYNICCQAPMDGSFLGREEIGLQFEVEGTTMLD